MATSNYVDYQNITHPIQKQLTTVFYEKLSIKRNVTVSGFLGLAQNEFTGYDDQFSLFSISEPPIEFLTIKDKFQ